MILGTGCLAESALDGGAIRAALKAVRLERALLVAVPGARPSGLSDLPAVAVRSGWEERDQAVSAARQAGALRLVLEAPPEDDLAEVCRSLFEQARSHPGLALAILTPRDGPLSRPGQLELVLDDLASLPLGYWHQPSRVHLRGEDDLAWLDSLGRHMVGMSLDDVLAGESGLPPGTGEVDLVTAAQLGGRSLVVALDTEPVPDVSLLRMAVRKLQEVGFS